MNKPVIPAAPFSLPVEYTERRVELTPSAADEKFLVRHARLAFKHRWMLLALAAASLLLALIATFVAQPRYTASTQIQIARQVAKVVEMDTMGDDGRYDFEFYETQYQLLKSRSVAEAVVDKLKLADNPAFLSDYGDEAARRAAAAQPRAERRAQATGRVTGQVAIEPVPGSGIVNIAYTAGDPEMAAKIANAYANAFIEGNLARRYEASQYARDFLRARLESVRVKLEQSEAKAADYARQNALVKLVSTHSGSGLDTADTLASRELAQVAAQLTEAEAARGRAEAEYRANSGGNAAATALSNPAINQLRGHRAELVGELGRLSADFGPEYPKVIALKSQIADLERQIGREEGRVGSSLGSQTADNYRQALAAERSLRGRLEQLKGEVLDQQKKSIGLNIMTRDVDTNRALYDALLQRYKEVGVAGGIGTNNVSIVDSALAPTGPSSPNLLLNLALALVVAIAAGVAAVFIREQVDDSVIAPGDFERRLGVALLGVTPAVADVTETRDDGSYGAVEEAYFSVFTALDFSTGEGTPALLSVTSSKSGEGKSTSAQAIARNLASVGRKVLLVDADFRDPSLHRRLGLERGRGLADLVTGAAQSADLVRPLGNGLDFLSAGSRVPNPPELLAGKNFAHALRALAKDYDHVVVDGPPMLGLSDAPLLASAVDATVFVLESGRTSVSQAKMALSRLRAVGAHVVGSVLTKLDSRASGYGYGYGYDYQYGA